MIKHKKGDIVIAVFVIMTLALTSTVLVMIYLADKNIKSEFKNPGEVSNLYAELESLNFNVFWTLKEAMISSYDEIALSQDYIKDSPDCMINGQKTFCGLSSNLNNVIQQKVLEKFLLNINTNIKILKENLKDKDTELIFDITKTRGFYDSFFNLTIKNSTLVYTSEKKDLIIRHEFDIVQEMKFEDIGLDSFESIWKKVELCRPLDFKTCFRLDNFDAGFEDVTIADNSFIKTTLMSKKELYIDEEHKKLEFSFLVKT